jgi:hypothetical protein
MKYTVYFEIGGKKMKTEVEADNEENAKYKIYGKIKFHKVELSNKSDDLFGVFGEIFR